MARVPVVGGRLERDAKEDGSEHFCPGCGVRMKFVPRYPWHFCHACLELAEDHQGRRLVFQATSPLGGFGWRYAEEAAASAAPCSAVICLIRKREVVVTEARFGGVVAEPLTALPTAGRGNLGVVRLSKA